MSPAAVALAVLLACGEGGVVMTERMPEPKAGPEAAQPAAVPVDEEPLHRLVLKNDYVIALHVTIAAGQGTRPHTHSHDGAAVRLTEATVSSEVAGKGPGQPQSVRPGDVSVAAYAKVPLTHRVVNLGNTTFEVIDLEFLRRPVGPTTGPLAPPVAENDTVRVYRWSLAPGESTKEHTHGRPYVIVAATPMLLAMGEPDGRSMEHPVKAGDVHWVDGRVTHVLTNRGPEPGILVEVELK